MKNDIIENEQNEFDDDLNDHLDNDLNSFLPVPVQSHELTVYAPEKTSSDPLVRYIRDISRYPLLSREQEHELTKALAESGDIEIAKKLVLHNLRLVVKIAMEYRSAYQNVMDLIQEGNIGLMKAVSKYNPEKGAKLSYYASWWIRSYILKFILDNFRLIKIGTTNEQKKLFYNLLQEKQRLISMGIVPDAENLSKSLHVSPKAINMMEERLTGGGEISIDQARYDGSSSTLEETISDGKAGIDDELAGLQNLDILKKNLGNFVSKLKPRDREIFEKRLLSEVPASLQAIADEYGVSRERIRQIEERLLGNLKVYMSEFIR